MKIINREFIKYKLINSLFLGISVGSIFTIYTPLEPSIYSIGGILLALAMLFTAKLYSKIINIYYLIDDEFDETQIRLNHEHTEYRYFTYKEILEGKEFIPGTIEIINDYIKNYYSKEYIVGN